MRREKSFGLVCDIKQQHPVKPQTAFIPWKLTPKSTAERGLLYR